MITIEHPLNIDPKLATQIQSIKPDLVLIDTYPNSPEKGTIFRSQNDGFYPDQNYSSGIKYYDYEGVKHFFQELQFNYKVIGVENNKISEVMMLNGIRRTFKKGDLVSHSYNIARGFTTRWVISHFEPRTHFIEVIGRKEDETCEPYRLFGVGGLVKMEIKKE